MWREVLAGALLGMMLARAWHLRAILEAGPTQTHCAWCERFRVSLAVADWRERVKAHLLICTDSPWAPFGMPTDG